MLRDCAISGEYENLCAYYNTQVEYY